MRSSAGQYYVDGHGTEEISFTEDYDLCIIFDWQEKWQDCQWM